MTGRRLTATRMNLVRARRELVRVRHGIGLTRRKREALVAELFHLARPAVDVRARIAESAALAYDALAGALAAHGASGLAAMAWSLRAPTVELRPAVVWGLAVSDVVARDAVARTLDARGVAPAAAGPAATAATARFEALADLLIDAAPREQRVRRLGDAVRETTRRLLTLEHQVAPRLAAQVATVRQQLEEREREEHLRLRHVQRSRQAPPR
ncbi:MAG TPA: V-type ATP synthase subunit D [Gemmatimonadaceae bacterium]|nr:V-type ATP synthase subunit D [Gemmatimonadaceae bacterium]